MAEMFAVPAAAAAPLHPVVLWQNQRRLVHHVGYRLEPWRAQARGIDRDAGIDQPALAVTGLEHLAGEGPEQVDRVLRAAVAFLGAVAETHDPLRGMAEVIGAFLFRFCRDRRQRRI